MELTCCVEPDVPNALVGDAVRLRQVLLNLVGNAIKFTDAGEVDVRVDVNVEVAGRLAPDDVGLRFTVRDTGIGIPPDQQERIFRAFEQEDASTTRQVRRHRPGLDHRLPAGGADGRQDHRGQRAGPGQHLRLHGAVRPTAAARRQPIRPQPPGFAPRPAGARGR